MVSEAEYLFYVDRALDGMTRILLELGDERANRKPDLPGANTPYQILTHCLGVIEFWSGQVVSGREVERDRAAEFTASGPVAELVERTAAVRARLAADVTAAEFDQQVRGEAPPHWRTFLGTLTQGAALLHVYEELAQHHGQLEVTRDALLGG
ncbi:DinB family protein [Crossiella sp. SN42]|uniref:DinB family protein n=1 Tax=Crossiella sp. SN42 TaxID=2944808 RepID=UPI00207CE5B4|nr:DinB family protein [Crossiella sp. SN42]MCO1582741.1 DinB family protein [Crossiella sp. SN42]